MKTVRYAFPDGKLRCLTMSYDDGREYDRRLVGIFNKYGIRGTFHLNAGNLDKERYVTSAEIPTLYAGHEVSCHTYTHPHPTVIPEASLLQEIIADKDALEKACGYIVRGMSYPFGEFDADSVRVFKTAGMEYSRTVNSTGKFHLPEDFMRWNPTCHHKIDLMANADKFLAHKSSGIMLFYVWGHSYEFEDKGNWDLIEDFCAKMANNERIWYATNIEIVDYVNAMKSLKFSQSLDMVYNPSATNVWLLVDGETVKVGAGETVRL